jgi:metallo-beta-lactamase family protein
VTGSCHEIRLPSGEGLLVDCGLFQGQEDQLAKLDQIPFKIKHIKALIVTHVHIDHVGRIPHLIAKGFDGPIYCTKASAKLLPMVLEDAIKVGLSASTQQAKRAVSAIKQQVIGIKYNKWQSLTTKESIKLRFQPAGHILGSAYAELDILNHHQAERVVFSGDLGASYTPLLPDPKSPKIADTLFIESTYGDKVHQGRKDRVHRLKEILIKCFENKGLVLIPAFSIGRTQELLYELESILHHLHDTHEKWGDWKNLDIVLDSPLAKKFTDSYREMKELWDFEAKTKLSQHRHPLNFDQLVKIDSHREHLHALKTMSKSDRPAIVISAGGMCNGGRIVNWLKRNIENPITDILLVGYQAKGTTGRELQNPRNKCVKLGDRNYDIKAKIHTLSAYSAHADQNDLMTFIQNISPAPKSVVLVHGINRARRTFRSKIQEKLPNTQVIIPHKIMSKKGYVL